MALDKKYLDALRSLLRRRERPNLQPTPLREAISETLGVGSGESTDPVIEYETVGRFLSMPMNNSTDSAGIPPGSDAMLLASKSQTFLGSVTTDKAATSVDDWRSTDGSLVLSWEVSNSDIYTALIKAGATIGNEYKVYSNTYDAGFLVYAPHVVVGACLFPVAGGTDKLIVACTNTSLSEQTRIYSTDWDPDSQQVAPTWALIHTFTWSSTSGARTSIRFSGSGTKGVAVYGDITQNLEERWDLTLSWDGSQVTVSSAQTYFNTGLEDFDINLDWSVTTQETETSTTIIETSRRIFYQDPSCEHVGEAANEAEILTILDDIAAEDPVETTEERYVEDGCDIRKEGYVEGFGWSNLATLARSYFITRQTTYDTIGPELRYYPSFSNDFSDPINIDHSLAITAPQDRVVAADFVGEDVVTLAVRVHVDRQTGLSSCRRTLTSEEGLRSCYSGGCSGLGIPAPYLNSSASDLQMLDIDIAYTISLVRSGAKTQQFPIYEFTGLSNVDRTYSSGSDTRVHTENTSFVQRYRKLLHYDLRTDTVIWQEGVQENSKIGTGTAVYSNQSAFDDFLADSTAFTTAEAYKDQSIRGTLTGQLGESDTDVFILEESYEDSVTPGSTEWARELGTNSIRSDEHNVIYDDAFAGPAFAGKSDLDGNCFLSSVNLFVPEKSQTAWVDVLLSGGNGATHSPRSLAESLTPGGTSWTWERTGYPNFGSIMLLNAKQADQDG